MLRKLAQKFSSDLDKLQSQEKFQRVYSQEVHDSLMMLQHRLDDLLELLDIDPPSKSKQ